MIVQDNRSEQHKETAREATAQVNRRQVKWIEGPVRVWNGIARREEKEPNAVAISVLTIAVAVQVEAAAVPAVFAAAA